MGPNVKIPFLDAKAVKPKTLELCNPEPQNSRGAKAPPEVLISGIQLPEAKALEPWSLGLVEFQNPSSMN